MADNKRYYWLRLYDDFFDSKRIKKLRKLAGGDTYTIIYLKIQLVAMKSGGVITFTGLEQDAAEEIALDIDESADDVRVTLAYLLNCGLAETSDNVNYFFPFSVSNTGSETASAQRVREHRERAKLLQCNNDVTEVKRTCNAEKEIEKETENSNRRVRENKKKPPTLEEVIAYAQSRNSTVDPVKFFEYFEAGEWKDAKGNKVASWKQKFLTWEKYDTAKKPSDMTQRHKYSQEEQNDALRDLESMQKKYLQKEKL